MLIRLTMTQAAKVDLKTIHRSETNVVGQASVGWTNSYVAKSGCR